MSDLRLLRILPLLAGLALVLTACPADDADVADDPDVADDDGVVADDEEEPDAPDDEDAPVVMVGLLNPDTGPFPALGEDVDDGFALYVDEHDGMLSGYRIETVTADEACDTAMAQEAAERMVERDNVDIIIGIVCTPVAYGVAPYIQETGVPLIITVAGANDLTQGQAAENIFRVSYTGSSDAMPGGQYMCEELGYETAAVVSLDFGFGWETAGGFARAYEDAGCEVIQELYVPLDTADWGPFVPEIDTSADAVWAMATGPDAVRFVEAYRDFGIDLPLVGHGVLTDEVELAQSQDAAEGIITTLHYSAALETDLNMAFRESFREAYGRSVSRYAEAGHAAAQVLEAALAEVDEVSHEALIEAIGNVQIESPRGPISFDEYGQAIYNVYVREVQEVDGEWQNTVIDTIENVSQFWTYDPEEYIGFPLYEELRGTWESN